MTTRKPATDELLTGPRAAERLGIAPATWRSYVARGYVPPADDPDADAPTNRSNPRWLASTVDQYAIRAGRGTRTDLAGDPAEEEGPEPVDRAPGCADERTCLVHGGPTS